VNSPDWKVISSTLAGWGCLAQAGRNSIILITARMRIDILVDRCRILELCCVFMLLPE